MQHSPIIRPMAPVKMPFLYLGGASTQQINAETFFGTDN